MGKKVKIGKQRKDKFYQLAKEAGYRSRAAFKLLQLNRTYHFLEKSRICVDLCAAPGGWLQVAASHMPVSSIIIGVDLAPIKPIANVITHQMDITTEKCRQALKKDLNDNKADVVLHDGAPNVGKNWLYDAYQQNMLVLLSFKLASDFLKKGGWFITKVFRSKDYYSIMWVFQQFFKKVESTKPQASRNESAEIFVICQGYKAPEKIDAKFFDIKYVFSDIENANENKKTLDIFKNDMNKRHRGGYPDGDMTLYHKLNASEFLNSENFIELLAKSNEMVLDEQQIVNHPETTQEIQECIKDIKLLGKNEIKNLLKWRLKLKEDLKKTDKSIKEDTYINKKEEVNKITDQETKENEEGESDEDKLDNEIKDALYNEKKIDKKKKRKLQKEKKKLKEKMSLKMNFQNDIVDHDFQGDNEIFSLNKIKTKKQLLELQSSLPGLEISDDEDGSGLVKNKRKKKTLFSKFDENNRDNDDDVGKETNGKAGSDGEDSFHEEDDKDAPLEFEEDNPLLARFEKESKTSSWFNKDAFDFLKDSNEMDENLLNNIELNEEYEQKINDKKNKRKRNDDDVDDDDDENKKKKAAKFDEFLAKDKEEDLKSKNKNLSAEELTIGEMMINSDKTRIELIDDSFNRYSKFGDESGLPSWFLEDEDKHYKRDTPLPTSSLKEYKNKDINAKPIKKVVEAVARKKKRLSIKLERARKKAETLSENTEMSQKEIGKEIKSIYKRAGLTAKKKVDIKYVVSKKGSVGKKVGKNVKGPYRIVDKRQKKDKRGKKPPTKGGKRAPAKSGKRAPIRGGKQQSRKK